MSSSGCPSCFIIRFFCVRSSSLSAVIFSLLQSPELFAFSFRQQGIGTDLPVAQYITLKNVIYAASASATLSIAGVPGWSDLSVDLTGSYVRGVLDLQGTLTAAGSSWSWMLPGQEEERASLVKVQSIAVKAMYATSTKVFTGSLSGKVTYGSVFFSFMVTLPLKLGGILLSSLSLCSCHFLLFFFDSPDSDFDLVFLVCIVLFCLHSVYTIEAMAAASFPLSSVATSSSTPLPSDFPAANMLAVKAALVFSPVDGTYTFLDQIHAPVPSFTVHKGMNLAFLVDLSTVPLFVHVATLLVHSCFAIDCDSSHCVCSSLHVSFHFFFSVFPS